MFEQYGTDHNLPALNLNAMLPSVNQSEASHSLLGTTFQRWLTKPEVASVAGEIHSYRTPAAEAVQELIASRQQQQLVPLFVYTSGSETVVKDWDDVHRKLEFTGADMSMYPSWGQTEVVEFSPPISLDKLHNWEDYYWADPTNNTTPDYITIVSGSDNPWGRSNCWKHYSALTNTEFQRAIRASAPIIEYHDIELNQWVRVDRTWKRYDSMVGKFRPTDAQPTQADMLSPQFPQRWELESETITPCVNQQLVDTLPGVVFYTNPTSLPLYVLNSNSVRVYFVTGTVWERRYDFVEISETAIQLLGVVPSTAQLRIYVGSSVATTVPLSRISTRTASGYEFKNLSTYFSVGQQKTGFNQQPVFNLYKVDGSFDSTGYVWKYKSDSDLDVVTELQQRVSVANSFVDAEFVTDLIDTTTDTLKAYATTSGVLSTIWSNVHTILPQRLDGTSTSPWVVPSWVQYNPNRETRAEYKLSELTQHVDAVGKGAYTIAVGHDSVNLLVSTLLADDLSVPNLLEFAAIQRESVVQKVNTSFPEQLVAVLSNNTNAKVAEIPALVYGQIKAQYVVETEQTTAFLDSQSQSPTTGVGFPNTTLSFAQMGLLEAAAPALPYVDGFGRLMVPSHERIGGQSIDIPVDFSVQAIARLERAIVANVEWATGFTPPVPTSPYAYWRNSSTNQLLKLEVDFFDVNQPFAPQPDATWFNPTTSRYYIWSNNVWQETIAATNWRVIDVKLMLAATLVMLEHDLYARALELGTPRADLDAVIAPHSAAHAAMVERERFKHVQLQQRRDPTVPAQTISDQWDTSGKRTLAHLVAAYRVSPIRFLDAVLDTESIRVNGVRINPLTQNLYKNTQRMHGELGWVDQSMLQLLVVYARYNKLTSRTRSPIDVFKTWTTKLGYRTGAIVVPQTLRIHSDCEYIDEFDIVLKKSENTRQIAFSNVIVTLHEAGHGNDLPYGAGDGWKFKLDCSGPHFFDNKRYGLQQQSVVWDSQYSVFRTTTGQPVIWETGAPVKFDDTYGPVDSSITLYVRKIPGTLYFQLADTAEQAADQVGGFVDFGLYALPPTGTLRQVERTFTTTSQYGSRVWTAVAPNRNETVTFDFPIIVDGVTGIVDFMQGYVPYMVDQGVVFNDGERPLTDPSSGEMLSWDQQLIRAIGIIYSSAGLTNRDYRGVGEYTDRLVFTTQFVEMNPFPTAIWINTKEGVLCDFNNTPYVAESRSSTALFDQLGQPITDHMTPLRADCITSVFYTPPAVDFNPQQFALGEQHIGSGRLSVDSYEHCVVFGPTTKQGYTIYNAALNLIKQSMGVEMQRSITHKQRPVLPGYVVTPTGTIPNFETIAMHQRNDYNAVMGNELVQTTQDVRKMLGKTPQTYFDSIPVTSKTEFNFWQRMIRQKGTQDAIEHLGKHSAFDATSMDEFWAWKLGTFGGTTTRKQYEFAVTRDMVGRDNACVSFLPTLPTSVESAFPITQLPPTNDRLWIDYPSFVDALGTDEYVRIPSVRRVSNILTQTPTGDVSGVESLAIGVSGSTVLIPHTSVSSAVEFELNVYGEYQSATITLSESDYRVRVPFSEREFGSADAVVVYLNDQYTTRSRRHGQWLEFDAELSAGDVVVVYLARRPVKLSRTLTQPFGAVKSAQYASGITNPKWTRTVVWKNLTTNATSHIDYEIVNNSVIRIYGILLEAVFCTLSIVEMQPDYAQFAPMRLADRSTSQILQPFPAWDPSAGVHTSAIGQVDVVSDTNPAIFGADKIRETDAAMWSEPQLGQYWWDTSNIRYKPYADETRYSFDHGSDSWGALYDEVEPRVYVWVKRSTPPSNASGGEVCYSRLLRKTRASFQFVVASNDDLNATVFIATNTVGTAFDQLVSSGVVAAYCTSPLSSEFTATGVSLGVEYELVVVSAVDKTFKLKSMAGDGGFARNVVLNSINPAAKFFVADTDWSNYGFEVMQPAHQRWLVCNNTHTIAGLDPRRDFVVTNPDMLSREYLEQFLTVWVNGTLAVHSYNETTKVINIVNPASLVPLYLTDNDEVFVECSLPEPNVVGEPPVSSAALTILVDDIPHTKITTVVGNTSSSQYYFWVRNLSTVIPSGKTTSAGDVARALRYPTNGGFMCARAARYNPTELEYSVVQLRGLVNVAYPESKSICIDFDQSIRDIYRDWNQKNTHEQWTLIREQQLSAVPYVVWRKVMETMLGFELNAYERTIDTIQPVKHVLPTATRSVYDFFHNTNTRYGSAPTQVLIERNEARALLLETMLDPTINQRPASAARLAAVNMEDDHALYTALVDLYATASTAAVNKLTFAVIKAGLFRGYHYSDVFKTSYVYIESTHQVN